MLTAARSLVRRHVPSAPVVALVLGLALVGASSPLSAAGTSPATPLANTGTARVDFKPSDWMKVDLDVHGVRVERILLKRPTGVTGLVTRHQEANRVTVTILNGSDRDIEPSVAVAAFDDEGHLLAAGNTGLSIKTLKAGQFREVVVHLGGVYRHLGEASTVYVTLEY